MTMQTSTRNRTRVVPEFGVNDRLRKARQMRGLSQGALGALVGLSHKIIGNIERGSTDIDGLQIYGWAEICAVDVNWIRTGEGSPFVDPQGPDGGIPNNVHQLRQRVGSNETDDSSTGTMPIRYFAGITRALRSVKSHEIDESGRILPQAA